MIMGKPIPYKGEKGYIFISYAHRDSELVLPIIEQMQRDGYRVWYDEGIDPGTEWDEFIASHVMGCGYFIAFLSQNYLRSENCKDELNFARDLKKPQALVYLEKVTLPRGIELRVGRCPSFTADTNGIFLRKLYKAEGIRVFHSGTKKENRRGGIVLGAVLLILLAAIGVGAFFAGRESGTVDSPGTPETLSENTESIQENIETLPDSAVLSQQTDISADNQSDVLLELNGVKIGVQQVYVNGSGDVTLTLNLENTSNEDAEVWMHTCHINGIHILGGDAWQVAPGERTQGQVQRTRAQLRADGIGGMNVTEDIKVVQFGIGVTTSQYLSGAFRYFPLGAEQGTIPVPAAQTNQILLDTGDFQLIQRDSFYDENNHWIFDYVFVNNTDREADCYVEMETVNGYRQIFCNSSAKAFPGGWIQGEIEISNFDWELTGYDRVEHAVMKVIISDEAMGKDFLNETIILYPEGNEDFEVSPKQLDEDDMLLLENEYVRVAVVETRSNGENSLTYDVYCQNISSDEWMRVYVEPADETGGSYTSSNIILPPGEQWAVMMVEEYEASEKYGSVSFTVYGLEDVYEGAELFREELEFTPRWHDME